MSTVNRFVAETIHRLVALVRLLTAANVQMHRSMYSSSRYSTKKLPQILAGLFEIHDDPVYMTENLVTFGELPFGINSRSIATWRGRPEYVRRDDRLGRLLQILFYKEDLGGYYTRESIYTLDDVFFYGVHNFSKDRFLGSDDIATIRRALIGKYLSGSQADEAAARNRFRITDTEGNMVVFNNSVNLTIEYYWGDKDIRQDLSGLYKDAQAAADRKLQVKRDALAGRL